MAGHWGDMPLVHDTESGIAAIEREQMTKPRPLEVEGEMLHQPSSIHQPATNEQYPKEDFAIDDMTINTIKLLQNLRKIQPLGSNAVQQSDTLFPVVLESPIKKTNTAAVSFVHRNLDSNFLHGIGTKPAEISLDMCQQLLRRSVAAILAHAGFDTCSESCLDTLTNILHFYLQQFTHLFRAAVDSDARRGDEGSAYFGNMVSRVFMEMGIENVMDLHEFYQTRIIGYHSHLIQQYKKLQQQDSLKDGMPEIPNNAVLLTMQSLTEGCTSDIQFPTDELEESAMDQLTPFDGV